MQAITSETETDNNIHCSYDTSSDASRQLTGNVKNTLGILTVKYEHLTFSHLNFILFFN